MEGKGGSAGPLTVVVSWRVRPGREREFEAWRREIAAAALKFPGHLGMELVVPAAAGGEYVVIFRFDSYEHLKEWQLSQVRHRLLAQVEPLVEREPFYRMETGLEYWFVPQGAPGPPAKWKMAAVTVLGVWPVSMVVPWVLSPVIKPLIFPLQALIAAVGIVVILTWAVMPVLVKLLAPWLSGRPEREVER